MGYRDLPHIVIAIQHMPAEGPNWILRATIDTEKFDLLITYMDLSLNSDAFLINRNGILQTHSKFYGKILESCPFPIPRGISATTVAEAFDHRGNEIILAYVQLRKPEYTLVLVKPRSVVLKTWLALKSEIVFIYLVSVVVIFLVVVRLSGTLVKSVREADEKRESAFRELEHGQKLSSIGRLAAGVAHEINNPIAIINEKAGLIKDHYRICGRLQSQPG